MNDKELAKNINKLKDLLELNSIDEIEKEPIILNLKCLIDDITDIINFKFEDKNISKNMKIMNSIYDDTNNIFNNISNLQETIRKNNSFINKTEKKINKQEFSNMEHGILEDKLQYLESIADVFNEEVMRYYDFIEECDDEEISNDESKEQ